MPTIPQMKVRQGNLADLPVLQPSVSLVMPLINSVYILVTHQFHKQVMVLLHCLHSLQLILIMMGQQIITLHFRLVPE